MSMSVQRIPGINIGCGDFQFTTANKNVMCARSMEFPEEMESALTVYPSGEQYVSSAPKNEAGLEWTSKYRFVGINGFHMKGIDEGMNEKGLSFGYLTLLNSEYQRVSAREESKALALMDVGAWILGNFKTVDEVVEALKDVIIWKGTTKVLGQIPGLHIALHDAEGKNLVIEFINGKVEVHENPLGVLTNNPVLKAQLENLENYKKLSPEPAKSNDIGSGMDGLPGGGSSKSRFVRIAKALQFALKPKDEKEGIILATHVLNTVDIVKGIMAVPIEDSKLYETTRWRVIKDLTNRILYYSSYNDPALRKIDLNNIKDKKTYNRLDVQAEEPTIIDVTQSL